MEWGIAVERDRDRPIAKRRNVYTITVHATHQTIDQDARIGCGHRASRTGRQPPGAAFGPATERRPPIRWRPHLPLRRMNALAPPPEADDWLAALNPAQRQAATLGASAGGHPPLLIVAGAGTGKTTTLAHRVAVLLDHGARPEALMLLTFSRRAADDMKRRVSRLLANRAGAGSALQLPWSGTFHGVGAQLLREYAGQIGLDPGFTIHDREDSADLMNLVRHEQGLSARQRRFPQKATCLGVYSSVINTCRPLGEVLQHGFPWCREWASELRSLFLGYVEAKQAQQVLDYDDLLLYWARMLEAPSLAAEIGARFSHVLVDEYQDTNRLQASILLALKPDGGGLTVVGDDAQSIYAFRGATIRNILDFSDQFEIAAERIALERNYRSTLPILAAANAVISLAGESFEKSLWTDRQDGRRPALISVRDDADQAACVVERVLARRETGIRLQEQAVLFRASHHSARLEIELGRHNIPFVKYGGLRFLEAAHVKDVLAVLRWSRNLRDRVSGFRAIQLLAGIGPRTASTILDNLRSGPAATSLLREQPVPAHTGEPWRAFAELVDSCRSDDTAWPAAFDRLCDWYLPLLDRLYQDPAMRQADIRQLAALAATYPDAQRFLTELTLDPPEASSAEAGPGLLDEDYLILSTIHSAKGQEWATVTLLNAVDGCLPSDLATGSAATIDEERRLLYVAMTRARDELDLMLPQRFYITHQPALGDRHVYAGRTRFIPNGLLTHFEQRSWPPQAPAGPRHPDPRQAAVDLAAGMRDMWR